MSTLDGYYEEGYHYYMEIRGQELTVRDYARRIELVTAFTADEDAMKRGEPAELALKDPVLSRDGYGRPFTWIKKLTFEGDRLEMDYYYTILGDKHYTIRKVDHGPFDHIVILDKEHLESLQGVWVDPLRPENTLEFKKNELRYLYKNTPLFTEKIHVVTRKTAPDMVFVVPEDLTQTEFKGLQEIAVLPDMLTTRDIVMDLSTPLRAFVRKENIGKVPLPPGVYEKPRNLMVDEPPFRRAEFAPLEDGGDRK